MSREGVAFGDWLVPEAELSETFDTSGGPGGQHANRNRTAVTIRFDVGSSTALPDDLKARITSSLGASYVEATSSDSRSQWRNRALARQRLASILEDATKTQKQRRPTKRTRASNQRRLEEKQRRAEKKRRRRAPEDW
jgi:ribosome-associated protein